MLFRAKTRPAKWMQYGAIEQQDTTNFSRTTRTVTTYRRVAAIFTATITTTVEPWRQFKSYMCEKITTTTTRRQVATIWKIKIIRPPQRCRQWFLENIFRLKLNSKNEPENPKLPTNHRRRIGAERRCGQLNHRHTTIHRHLHLEQRRFGLRRKAAQCKPREKSERVLFSEREESKRRQRGLVKKF